MNQYQVEYKSGVSVNQGNELTPTEVKHEPVNIQWPVETGAYYTLCMIGNNLLNIYVQNVLTFFFY